VLWYLAGHLIESTVVPLELYFEHRNYIPIIGPLFALGSFLFLYSARLRRIACVGVPVFAFVSASFLYTFASLSGDPSSASRYWALKYPASPRAVSRMAKYQLDEESPLRALQTIDSFATAQPRHAYLRIPALDILCRLAPDQDHRQVIEQLERELPEVDFAYNATRLLFGLFNTTSKSTCNGVNPGTVASLTTTLHGNPRYTNEPLFNQFHQKLLATIARDQGDYDAAIDHLQQAIAHGQSRDINKLMVTTLGGAGEFDAARNFIDNAKALRPANPVKALMWQRDLDILREHIRKLEQYVRTQPRD
jgi:tetratricopeptide (TPR) repeat protein